MANRLIEVTNGLNILVNYGTEIEVERNSTIVVHVKRSSRLTRDETRVLEGNHWRFAPLGSFWYYDL